MDTDIVSGDFRFDTATKTVVSKGAQKAYLDPEIAAEGTKVILSDGTEITYNPPPAKAVIPDISEIKSLRKYFNRTDYFFFPTWMYHPTQPPAIAKNAEEAWTNFGVRLLERTDLERRQYGGGKYRWEMTKDWSTQPYDETPEPITPLNVGHGKNLVTGAPDPLAAQNTLVANLIPTVTAAVVTALKASGQGAAPSHIDQKEWDEFLAFQAFKKTQAALDEQEGPLRGPRESNAHEAAMDTLRPDIERTEWETKAKEAGIKIDGRWSLDKLRKHVMTALEARVTMADGTQQFPTQDTGTSTEVL